MGGIETLRPCSQTFPAAPPSLPLFSSDEVDLVEVAQVALPALQKISSQEWQEALRDVGEISVKRLSGALTNKVFECKWREPSGKSRRVLVRLYGSEVDSIFSRQHEVETFERLSRHGYGPQLLARFPAGRVEEWLHARTLTLSDLSDPVCSARIAAKLAVFHRLDMGAPRSPLVWSRMRAWLHTALEVASPLAAAEFCLAEIEEEIAELEAKLGGADREGGEAATGMSAGRTVPKAGSGDERTEGHTTTGAGPTTHGAAIADKSRSQWGVGFCHNDLQYGNLMADERTGAITIIDYEYAGYNPIAFDIGNHFCEFAADYHSDAPHLLDYSRYPSLEQRLRFCQAYLSASGNDPSEEDVASLVKEADCFTLLSHLQWGLWGVIFSASSNIEFDYAEYSRQRFRQYFLCKEGLLDGDSRLPAVYGSRS